MKTIKISFFTLLISLVGFSGNLFAQEPNNASEHTVSLAIGKTSLLEVIGNASMTFGGGATEAGAAISIVAADSTSRIRISSALEGAQTRKITASISALPNPNGAILYVTPMAPNASFVNTVNGSEGYGTLASQTEFEAATTAYDLVTAIGGICWTGTTDGDGYVLKYNMEQIDGVTFVPATYTITYTLVDTF